MPKRLALPHKLYGHVERTLRGRMRRHGNAEPFLRQLAHQIDEALAFFAQTIGHRHADVFKEHFRRVRRVEPDLVEIATAFKAFAVGLDEDDRDTFPRGLHLRVGLDADEDQVRRLTIGDIGFGPVDDIVIAVLLRGGAQRLKVRTGAGFGHCDGGNHFARDHFGEPVPLLLLGAVGHDVVGDDVRLEREAGRGVSIIANLLVDDRVVAEVEAEAAISFRDGRAEQAEFARLGPDVAGDDAVFIPFRGVGLNLSRDKLADRLAKCLMIFGVAVTGQGIERHGGKAPKAMKG